MTYKFYPRGKMPKKPIKRDTSKLEGAKMAHKIKTVILEEME